MKSGTVFIREHKKVEGKNVYVLCGIIVTDEDDLYECETMYKITDLELLKKEKLENKGGWGFDELLASPIWKV